MIRGVFDALDLVPDLVPKYMVTVGTRWYLLGLAAALPYQRVPTSPNSHKHNQDSNSLGGTIKPQVRSLSGPISRVKSGHKCLAAQSGCGVKAQLREGQTSSRSSVAVPVAHSPIWACLVVQFPSAHTPVSLTST